MPPYLTFSVNIMVFFVYFIEFIVKLFIYKTHDNKKYYHGFYLINNLLKYFSSSTIIYIIYCSHFKSFILS